MDMYTYKYISVERRLIRFPTKTTAGFIPAGGPRYTYIYICL